MKGANTRDRPEYDDADEIGEDPMKYLYYGDVVDGQPSRIDGEGDPLAMARARIRGIERMDRLMAFQKCEVELGPRAKIMKYINRRKAELEADDAQPARADMMTRTAAADGGSDR